MKERALSPSLVRVQESFKALSGYKSIQIYQLNEFGYLAGDNSAALLGSTGKVLFELVEMVDAYTRDEASFCFLWNESTEAGYILPEPYSDFMEVDSVVYDDSLVSL